MGRDLELLAPAGSYESFEAALLGGADAVYIGGGRFGARAFAKNFTEDELLLAIDTAHLHGKKVFLTVNTLLRDDELSTCLYPFLRPLYERGLDAVIVQDLGTLLYIRACFPGLPIHASTQMTVTDITSVRFLERLGVTRVVTSRELSLEEIRSISSQTSLEIESFVHGALCYSYSGQCLFSSLVGGRSGNRGQCAQPCRLPYRADGGKRQYLLSLKDLCTLALIPELAEAGIDSFKIEGRMKHPAYVFTVVSIYRSYMDRYLTHGKEGYAVDPGDVSRLMDVYNRGGFTDGYYKRRNGRDMVSLRQPDHIGVPAARLLSPTKGVALTDLHRGDTLEIPGRDISFSFDRDAAAGERVSFSPRYRLKPEKTREVRRTFNRKLTDDCAAALQKGLPKEKICGRFVFRVGRPAELTVRCRGVCVSLTGDTVLLAERSPLTAARLLQQLEKTGGTPFVWDDLSVDCADDGFLPMQSINELRREALERLESELLLAHARCGAVRAPYPERLPARFPAGKGEPGDKPSAGTLCYTALISRPGQLLPVLSCGGISDVYLDGELAGRMDTAEKKRAYVQRIHASGKGAYVALPRILRKEGSKKIRRMLPEISDSGFDGVLIRGAEEYELLKEEGYSGRMIADTSLYMFNRISRSFWEGEGLFRCTVPVELNQKEIARRGGAGDEGIVYGYLPLMLSAQCIACTTGGCDKKPRRIVLTDRQKEKFMVENRCDFCYNIVYNSRPLDLLDRLDDIAAAGIGYARLQFTAEDEKETARILCRFAACRAGRALPPDGAYTRGHFTRGVR